MTEKQPELITQGPAVEKSGLVHRVLVPDTPGPHPTVVMIHGRAGDENVMWVFARSLPPNCLIVAPRAIMPDPDDGGYTWHGRSQTGWPTVDLFTESTQAMIHFVQSLPELYNADKKRIYFMGFSQGAAVSYMTALAYPGLVKGIAGLVGLMPDGYEPLVKDQPLYTLPVLMIVGQDDETIPLAQSLKCRQALLDAGTNLQYHEYATGHRLNPQGTKVLAAWWADRAEKDFVTEAETDEP